MYNFKHLLPKILFIFTLQIFHSSYIANVVDLGTREWDMGGAGSSKQTGTRQARHGDPCDQGHKRRIP
jgi:hypothetical protein